MKRPTQVEMRSDYCYQYGKGDYENGVLHNPVYLIGVHPGSGKGAD
jgi:hypothetical protein